MTQIEVFEKEMRHDEDKVMEKLLGEKPERYPTITSKFIIFI